MNFKRILTVAAVLGAAPFAALAADDAAGWAKAEKANLDAINPTSLTALIKGAPDSYVKLFTEVKTDYQSSPLEITRVAALTQFIISSGNTAERSQYADELVKAAQGATAGDVTCFFLDQLRWCATPDQSAAIKSFESSTQRGVAALAAIAALAAERNFESQQKDIQENVYALYSEQISKLQGSQLVKTLISGFNNADLRIAGLALREASQIDAQNRIAGLDSNQAAETNKRRLTAGREETMVWALTLTKASDPVRKVMLLDMLGIRGNPAAITAVTECISDADIAVATAAQNALIKISPEAYTSALPALLKNLPQSHAAVTEQRVMLLPGKLIESTLLKEYESYSQPGQEIILSVLKNRKSRSGITLALAAINSTANESAAVNGYRLLRDSATSEEADVLVDKLLTEKGKKLQEAQSAVAGAAKRDTTGSYIAKLEDVYKKASGATKQDVLATFGRIGSKPLLMLTESAVKDADKEMSTAAVRALAEWPDNDSIKALMSVALESTDNKQRVLAQRGIEKKLGAQGVDKAPFTKMWGELSQSGQGDAEIKKQLDAFFSK